MRPTCMQESIRRGIMQRASAAAALASSHGLPDVSDQSYGDVDPPDLSAEETAGAIEVYVDSVAALVAPAAKQP